MAVRTEADQISEETKKAQTGEIVSYACVVMSIFDFASAVVLLWVVVYGHPHLGWVTVVGLVLVIVSQSSFGGIGHVCW